MKLPQLVKCNKTRWIHFFVGGAATLLLYQLTNRMHIVQPKLLEFGPVDHAMPFWTWTVWIYFTEYLFFIYAYFWMRNLELVTRYYYAYMAILLISEAVFVVYPVTFPRDQYPVVGNSISDQALLFLRTYMDQPANCLPSLHVSSCFISSLCFWQESRIRAVLLSIWSCFVAVATMTTKQHYFIDVWTAMALTAAAYYYFFYLVRFEGSGREAGARA